jgi:hypothetical protein
MTTDDERANRAVRTMDIEMSVEGRTQERIAIIDRGTSAVAVVGLSDYIVLSLLDAMGHSNERKEEDDSEDKGGKENSAMLNSEVRKLIQ